MVIVYAFLFSGIICLIGELLLLYTKLTPGHVTTLFSVIGGLLSFLGIYKIFISKCHMGAIILISNFGNSLYVSSYNGYIKEGFLGIFKYMLTSSSLVISSTIIFSFIFAYISRPKD